MNEDHVRFKKELLSKIKINKNGCWIWQYSPSQGYGEYRRVIDGIRFTTAHRASYYLFKGVIKNGLMVLHNCGNNHKNDNPRCIRPSHLYTGNHEDNMKDMTESGVNAKENNPMYGKPGTRLGVILSEETKDKIRNSQLGEKNHMYGRCGEDHPKYGIPLSDLTKMKISKSRKGKRKGKENTSSRSWIIINPSGEKFIVDDMVEFCNKNSIKHISFITNKKWHGWKCQHYIEDLK